MRKKEGHKEQDIIGAAIKVFGKKGFDGAKMHHIADTAGVGIGTVYLYFRNKEKILLRVFEVVWNDLYTIVSTIKNNPEFSPMEKLDRLIDNVFDYFAKNPEITIVLLNQHNYGDRSRKETPFQTMYVKTIAESELIIAEGQKTGVFNPSISTSFFQFFFKR